MARYCDGRCRTAAHRERRKAEQAMAQLATLEAELAQARTTVIAAMERVMRTAREDEPGPSSFLADQVRARSAMIELTARAAKYRDARAVVRRNGFVPPDHALGDSPLPGSTGAG